MGNSKLEKKEEKIFTLEGSGKKLAFTNVNRQMDKSIVNAKKKSIEANGLLSPITVVGAIDVTSKGYDVFDTDTNEKVKNAEEYLVIIDGQHRYKAIKELNKANKYFDIWLMYPINKEIALSSLIMEINTTSINWKNNNYIDVLAKLRPDDKGLAFLQKYANMKHKRTKKGEVDDGLPNNGYGLSVLSKYLTFSPEINKDYLYKMTRTPDKKLPDSVNVDRAENIINHFIEKGFTHRYLTHRFFIDTIIKLWNSGKYSSYKDILEHIDKHLPVETVKEMMNPEGMTLEDKYKECVPL